MSVLNHTPFPAIAFRHYNLGGQLNGVVAVRGTFQLVSEAPLAIAEEQAPLVLADVYDGEDAHAADLIARPWLRGDEPFELRNLLPGYPRVRGNLPGIRLRMQLPRGKSVGVSELVLDGVHFDLRPRVWRVFLTWRTSFPWSDGAGRPELVANRSLSSGVA